MIRHMVLFNLRADVADSDREGLFASIRDLARIPSIRRIEIGTLVEPTEPSYRSHMSSDYAFALLADFDDEEGLYAYQRDPAHVVVAKEIRKRVTDIRVIDFMT